MKKTWEEPRILVQEFTPNEYVSACGDIVENLNLATPISGFAQVYIESNGEDGLQIMGKNADNQIGTLQSYVPSTQKQNVTSTNYEKAYLARSMNNYEEAYIWRLYSDKSWIVGTFDKPSQFVVNKS